ncbi:hypothetical protein ACLRAC_05930 [Gallibacterium anatis]|uniref:hypothetical protein n=1 Tax=Gallibacterium anatis TaxID=750 RepID=UPI0039FCA392
MKSFTLVVTATFVFRDETEIGIKWASEQGATLSDAQNELNCTIADLMADCAYALPILASFFEELSQKMQSITATASVMFEGKNDDWKLAFTVPRETEANKYIRALLFRLLTDKKRFLREVKALEKQLY